MPVQTVELGGTRRATYEVTGDGRVALMLPGGPGLAGAYMRGDGALFADVLRSHLIDPHGSGGSTPPEDHAQYSPEGHARFYEEARSALGLGPVVVFGHSFGATTALTYAAMYPESVQACIAVAAFGVGTEQDRDEGGTAEAEMDAMLARHDGAAWYADAKAIWDGWTERVLATDDPGEVESMLAAVLPLYTAHPERPEVRAALEEFSTQLQADLVACKVWESGLFQQIDLRPMLGRVRAPVLVVAGELDLICGPAQARPIAEALPNSALALIPDCGHMPSMESPDLFRSTVVDWLTAHPA
jgi:pimeloyl-ACP methyl ester carboxylesterase